MTHKGYEFTDVEIKLKDDEPLGVTLALNLSVFEVRAGSPAHGKIKKRDRIIQINGQLLYSALGLDELVQRFRPRLLIRIFKQRPGFDYINTHITLDKTAAFGLWLKDHHGRVFAGRVGHGTLAYRAGIQMGDHIVHVEGQFVADRETTKRLILKSMKEKKFVDVLLERAANETTKRDVSQVQESARLQTPSVLMPSDVHEIVAQQQARMRQHNEPEPRNILASPSAGNTHHQQHVNISNEHQTVNIRDDHPGKKLMKVTKKK